MTEPLITVLMPAHNAARFIGLAIRSVLAQSVSDFELLIIDDGSTDSTRKEVSHFTDPRVRLLSNSQNIGLVRTLNRGITEARGKYIARLDADDLCYPTRFAQQADLLDNQSIVGLVATWTEIIDESGYTRGFGNWRLSPEAIYYVLHFRQCLTHSSVMLRTRLVRELGGYSDVKAEDFDLWHRVSKVSRIVQIPEVLVKWRRHSGSITGTGNEELQQNAFRLTKKHVREVTGETWPDEIVQALLECPNLAKLEGKFLADFPSQLIKTQNGIADTAPADLYDRTLLRAYIEIEAAKYNHILDRLGTSLQLSLSPRARALGFMHCLRSYYRLPIISRLIPKTHF